MDTAPTVAPGIRRLTVNLDREDLELFEDLWPVPEGVALHTYLIEGARRVLVDPWDAGGYGAEELAVDLADLGLGWKDIAAVAFTKEPRPGTSEAWKALVPGIEVWGAPGAGVGFDLGAGVSVEDRSGGWFVPSVGAWLTGDAFAGLGWVEDEVWAEDLGEDAARYFDDEALRWYCFRPLAPEPPEGVRWVLPAHGCGSKAPGRFVERARRFEAWGRGEALDEVTVVWPDGAGEGADALVGGALDCGVGLNLFRLPGDDPTALTAGVRRASLVVVAADLDDSFLNGLQKDVWRPRVSTPATELRAGLVRRWEGEP